MAKVLLDIDQHIAHVRLNRPEKRNGLDLELMQELVAAGEAVASSKAVRAVVLSGEGPSFCAGLDVAAMMGNAEAVKAVFGQRDEKGGNLAQRTCTVWQALAVPVIGAIHGHCFGGGLQIALGADLRYATPDAQLSIMEIKWGLIPDMGITQTLPRLLRMDVAKELTFTGRVVTGSEAERLGLVTYLSSDPLKSAKELAATIASKSPDAISRAKTLYNEAWRMSAPEALALEETLQRQVMGAPNQLEAVMANMQKRAPAFKERS